MGFFGKSTTSQEWSKTGGNDRCTTKYDDGSSRDVTKRDDGGLTVTDIGSDGKAVSGDGVPGIFGIMSNASRINTR